MMNRAAWINSQRLTTSLLGFLLAACVTVNVNFPEGTVQKAADDYVRELYKAKDKNKAAEPDAAKKPKSSLLLNLELIPSAHAQDAELKVNTEKAAAIKQRQAARLDELTELKKSGAIGENAEGYLTLKKAEGLKALQKKHAEKLVQEENADRKALYEEVVKANGQPESFMGQVQRSFARSFQALSPSGTQIESSAGQWEKKP